MICSKCGHSCDDGSKFCPNCGARSEGTGASEVSCEKKGVTAACQQADFKTEEKKSVLDLVKKLCSSTVVLVALVCHTAVAVINLINNFLSVLGGGTTAFDNIDYEGISPDNVAAFSVLGLVISTAIVVPMLVGLWITYCSAANRRVAGVKTVGLSIVKVVLIIDLVLFCVICGILEFCCLISLLGPFANITRTIILVLIIAAVFAPFIIFYSKAAKTVDTVKRTIKTGRASDDVSSYVAVMICIMGGISLIFALSPFTSGKAIEVGSILLLVSGLCELVSSFAFAAFIFKYKDTMRPVMYQNFGYQGANILNTPDAPTDGSREHPFDNGPTGFRR